MKKAIITLVICGVAALSGCANDNALSNGRKGIYQQSGNTLNVNDERPDLYNENGRKGLKDQSKDFGYVRHQRTGIMGQDGKDAYVALDREQIADVIGKLNIVNPDVDDVSTLVTDEEVLIVYRTDSANRSKTADQVKKTAMSVIPGWFHVYVSDDTNLRKDIENFASLDTDSRDVDNLVDGVIKQMLKSPQGKKMTNDESQAEMNDQTK